MQHETTLAFYRAGSVAKRSSAFRQPVSPAQFVQVERCGTDGEVTAFGKVDEGRKEVMVNDGEEADGVIESCEPRVEEADPAKTLPSPYVPTQAEIDEHNVDHVPYRCWCPHCCRSRLPCHRPRS